MSFNQPPLLPRSSSNKFVYFVHKLFAKWYFLITGVSLVVLYWIFKGLYELGLINQAEKIVYTALYEVEYIAKHCTKKIINLKDFFDCIDNIPDYIYGEGKKPSTHYIELVSQNDHNSNIFDILLIIVIFGIISYALVHLYKYYNARKKLLPTKKSQGDISKKQVYEEILNNSKNKNTEQKANLYKNINDNEK